MSATSKRSSDSCWDGSRSQSNPAACSSRVLEASRREKGEIDAKCKRTVEKLAALKEKYELLERENGELSLQKVEIEGECRKCRRELKVKEVEVERLETDLRVSMDRERSSNARYEKLMVEIERVGRERDQIEVEKAQIVKEMRRLEIEKRRAEDKADEYLEELEKVKREKREEEEIIRELMVKIEGFEAEKRKIVGELPGCLNETKSVEEEGEEMQRVVKEKEDLERDKRRVEMALESHLQEAERIERERDEEIKMLKVKKRKREAELVNWLERVRRVETEKDEIIDGLMKKKEHLEMEKQEAGKKYEMLKKKVLKMEEDVEMGMDACMSSSERLASSHANALNVDESSFDCNAVAQQNENVQDGASPVQHHYQRLPLVTVPHTATTTVNNGHQPPIHRPPPAITLKDQRQSPTTNTTSHEFVEPRTDPGPLDGRVLYLQDQHRSSAICAGEDRGPLKCRIPLWKGWDVDDRVLHYVKLVGLFGVHRLVRISLDRPLITALLERWRQETHTFHLPVGEATITLQDVAILMGLRVHGPPVIGTSDLDWVALFEELLGFRPSLDRLNGLRVRITWLRHHFSYLPQDATQLQVEQHARAYILLLIGGVLFTNKSRGEIQLLYLQLLRDWDVASQYSWGSAALAYLYRQLCQASKRGVNEIAGPLILLQLWSWEHIPIGRPVRAPQLHGDAADPLGCRWLQDNPRVDAPRSLLYYRIALDHQRENQMCWEPYTSDVLEDLPTICRSDQHVWRSVVPLICFDIIEWYFPDRVMRQFGLSQSIPQNCDTMVDLHNIDRRGKSKFDWASHHDKHVPFWDMRDRCVISGTPVSAVMNYNDPYMVWYRRITRLFVTPTSSPSEASDLPIE